MSFIRRNDFGHRDSQLFNLARDFYFLRICPSEVAPTYANREIVKASVNGEYTRVKKLTKWASISAIGGLALRVAEKNKNEITTKVLREWMGREKTSSMLTL